MTHSACPARFRPVRTDSTSENPNYPRPWHPAGPELSMNKGTYAYGVRSGSGGMAGSHGMGLCRSRDLFWQPNGI